MAYDTSRNKAGPCRDKPEELPLSQVFMSIRVLTRLRQEYCWKSDYVLVTKLVVPVLYYLYRGYLVLFASSPVTLVLLLSYLSSGVLYTQSQHESLLVHALFLTNTSANRYVAGVITGYSAQRGILGEDE